jgi:hypothetical protein
VEEVSSINVKESNDLMKLHMILGHLHPGAIKHAISKGFIQGKYVTKNILSEKLDSCKTCMIAKSKSKP